jgi:hypothetical protein
MLQRLNNPLDDARLAEDALQAAWDWLQGRMAEGKDVAAVELVGFVRARCPGADLAFIRAGIWRRLMGFTSSAATD